MIFSSKSTPSPGFSGNAKWPFMTSDRLITALCTYIQATNAGGGFGSFDELSSQNFDRKALSAKGLQYEKLDQLTMDILFGVA